MKTNCRFWFVAASLLLGQIAPMEIRAQNVVVTYPNGSPIEVDGVGQQACNIPFVGSASGGRLVLVETLNRNPRFASLETKARESADSIARRLVHLINEKNPFDVIMSEGTELVASSGGTLRALPGACVDYCLAGTEVGLGIPSPPVSLTCSMDKDKESLTFRWKNTSEYDEIRVIRNSASYASRGEVELPGTSERFDVTFSELWQIDGAFTDADDQDADIWVVGVRNNIPSNAAALHVVRGIQEELSGLPFSGGVTPNWIPWSLESESARDHVDMGERRRLTASRENPHYNPVATPVDKPYYQILRSPRGSAVGISRKFLGLNTGGDYKVTIRLSTQGVAKDSTDWFYSFHALSTASSENLTARQMALLDPLPATSGSSESGCVVKYDHKSRHQAYEESGKVLRIPDGANEITVWLTFRSARPDDTVSMDYVRLEDLNAS